MAAPSSRGTVAGIWYSKVPMHILEACQACSRNGRCSGSSRVQQPTPRHKAKRGGSFRTAAAFAVRSDPLRGLGLFWASAPGSCCRHPATVKVITGVTVSAQWLRRLRAVMYFFNRAGAYEVNLLFSVFTLGCLQASLLELGISHASKRAHGTAALRSS